METLASIAKWLLAAPRGLFAHTRLILAIHALGIFALCLYPQQLPGQEDEKPPEAKPPTASDPASPDALKEGTLDLSARIYLPDKNGIPRLVPNVRLSDVYELTTSQGRRGDGDSLPAYKFDQFVVEAKVDGKVVDLRNRVTLTLNEAAQKVTSVPLRLQSFLLTQVPEFEGPGTSQLQLGRSELPGYVWWLQAEPKTTHTVTLVGQSSVQSEGDRQSLQLTLPGVLATVELTLPATFQDVVARGQGGEQLTEQVKDGSRLVSIRCNGGDLNISWRTGSASQPSLGAIELTNNTRWTIDDPASTWEADSELSVRAHGDNPVDKLVVELPVGAEWIPSDIPQPLQYAISKEEPTAAKTTNRLIVKHGPPGAGCVG